MKKLNLYLLTVMMIALPVMQSCDDDDGYSLGDWVERMATIRVLSGNTYTLEIDNGERLWVAASEIPWYRPVDGQRVIANYTLLSDEYDEYDHMVKVNFIWNVLTKRVEQLTEANEAEYGNDVVSINDMWVGGNYLNVLFTFNLPNYTRHRVSLVENTTVQNPNDGYIHLEYRYNNNNDQTVVRRRSMVSFNLGEYGPGSVASTQYRGIKIKINSSVNGERILTYDFADAENDTPIENSSEIDFAEGKID